MQPQFHFAVCQVGAEKVVKAEVIEEFPQLRFAFSRPGFITFKDASPNATPITAPACIFIRLWGQVLGQAKNSESLQELLTSIPPNAIVHAFDRDTFTPGDEPKGYSPQEKIIATLAALPKPYPVTTVFPKPGDSVYDLIWIDDNHVFLGSHIHSSHLDPSPGNRPVLSVPEGSPSRAYFKIVEAIHRFQPSIKKGMQVLELGCSPGGATLAMLERGLQVTGIDPQNPDEVLHDKSQFHFIRKAARDVTAQELRNINPSWIVMDMNIAPHEALDELETITTRLYENFKSDLNIQHSFLTIKLNDWKFAQNIPAYLKRLKKMGFQDLTALQLNSNRQEFFVYTGRLRT